MMPTLKQRLKAAQDAYIKERRVQEDREIKKLEEKVKRLEAKAKALESKKRLEARIKRANARIGRHKR